MSSFISKIKKFFNFRYSRKGNSNFISHKRKAAEQIDEACPIKKPKHNQHSSGDDNSTSSCISSLQTIELDAQIPEINNDSAPDTITEGRLLIRKDKVNQSIIPRTVTTVGDQLDQQMIASFSEEASQEAQLIADEDDNEEPVYMQFCRFMLPYGFSENLVTINRDEKLTERKIPPEISLPAFKTPLPPIPREKSLATKATITIKPRVKIAATMTCENQKTERYRTIGVSDDVIDDNDQNSILTLTDYESEYETEDEETAYRFTSGEVDTLIWINSIADLDYVIISKFSLNVTVRDIQTLKNDQWLNDVIMNFYLNLISSRSDDNNNYLPKVFPMNTFFFERLTKMGYPGVVRWTRKIDLFAYDIIPIPVHIDKNHWSIAFVYIKERTIKYYDSLKLPIKNSINILIEYMEAEHLDKKAIPMDKPNFTVEIVKNCPHQTNTVDCGVFSCMFANYICKNKNITFNQDNMPYFRKRMTLEIINGQLLN